MIVHFNNDWWNLDTMTGLSDISSHWTVIKVTHSVSWEVPVPPGMPSCHHDALLLQKSDESFLTSAEFWFAGDMTMEQFTITSERCPTSTWLSLARCVTLIRGRPNFVFFFVFRIEKRILFIFWPFNFSAEKDVSIFGVCYFLVQIHGRKK